MAIEMQPIKSSALLAHGYDPETGTLRVQLHNGKTYEYEGVPVEKYVAFTGAASPGAFWNSRIKTGHQVRDVTPKPKPGEDR